MGKVNAWFKGCQVYWIFLEDIAIKLTCNTYPVFGDQGQSGQADVQQGPARNTLNVFCTWRLFYRHLTSLCLGIFDLFTSPWPWPWLSRSWCPWSHNKLSLHHLNEKLRRHYNRTSVIEVVNVSSSKKVKLFKIETRIWLHSQSSSLVWSLSLFLCSSVHCFFSSFFCFLSFSFVSVLLSTAWPTALVRSHVSFNNGFLATSYKSTQIYIYMYMGI